MKVIGSGGYGCVVSPSLPLVPDGIVTYDNNDDFVTKVASDAQEEYDKGVRIQERLGRMASNVGIFPVEVFCGITRETLRPVIAEVLIKCDKPLQVAKKHKKRFDYTAEDSFQGTLPLCAVQVPKFGMDLFQLMDALYKQRKVVTYDDGNVISTRLLTMLALLHKRDVFHLDIKPENIAVFAMDNGLFYETIPGTPTDTVSTKMKYFDWGYCEIVTDWIPMISRCRKIMENDYYFETIFPFIYTYKTIKSFFFETATEALALTASDDPALIQSVVRRFLCYVDLLAVMQILVGLIPYRIPAEPIPQRFADFFNFKSPNSYYELYVIRNRAKLDAIVLPL